MRETIPTQSRIISMARKNNGSSGIVVLAILGGIISIVKDNWGIIIFIIGLSAVIMFVVNISKYYSKLAAQARIKKQLNQVIDRNIDALARRRAQLAQPDPYGNIVYDRWIKEVDYFISTNLFRDLSESDLQIAREISSTLFDSVEQATSLKVLADPPHQEFNDNMTATEFEHYCAEELRRSGWEARVTMASRDQGVDVIAEKGGARIVVQCKLYKSPVGNKAVQEIVAARTHENADYGIVVTNNSFTSSANELANTNNVFLIHYRDLSHVDKILGIKLQVSLSNTEDGGSANPERRLAKNMLDKSAASPFWRGAIAIVAALAIIVAAGKWLGDISDRLPLPSEAIQETANEQKSTPLTKQEARRDSSIVAAKDQSTFTQSSGPADPREVASINGTATTAPSLPKTPTQTQTGSTADFQCKPVTTGSVSSVEVHIKNGNWSVVHILKKGAPVERAKQYWIRDTSDGVNFSWEGQHQRNSVLKMMGKIIIPNRNEQVIYTEDVFDINKGKVSETSSRCTRLD
ncbi:MAG: restriction endonuclease [Methylocystis sp.]